MDDAIVVRLRAPRCPYCRVLVAWAKVEGRWDRYAAQVTDGIARYDGRGNPLAELSAPHACPREVSDGTL